MQFLKYLAVGLINTLVGYGAFYVLIRFLQVVPEVANALGYTLALTVAFILNKLYVFQGSGVVSKALPKFIFSFLISFLTNQLVFVFFYRLLEFSAETSQIPAMLSYTITFYLLNKYFVFSGVTTK